MNIAHAATFALTNPLTANDFISLLQTLINGLIRLAIPITVIMIIWAAVQYITSPVSGRISAASKGLLYAIIGFGILLISSGIISIIQDFLGVKKPGVGVTTQGPSTLADVIKILTDASGWLFAFAIIAGIAMIIVAGLYYIFSGGDTSRSTKALNILKYAVVGIAIATLAWAIINIVANFLTGKPIFATLNNVAHASTLSPPARPSNAPSGGPKSLGDIYKLIQQALGWLFTFAVIAGVAMFIIAGIRFIFSGGDPQASRTARWMVIYGIVGIAIVALAWALVNLVGHVLVDKQLITNASSPRSMVLITYGVRALAS